MRSINGTIIFGKRLECTVLKENSPKFDLIVVYIGRIYSLNLSVCPGYFLREHSLIDMKYRLMHAKYISLDYYMYKFVKVKLTMSCVL